MNGIHPLSVVGGSGLPRVEGEEVSIELPDDPAAELARIFQVSCHVHEERFIVDFAYDPPRGQYHSTAILQRMESLVSKPQVQILGVTSLDCSSPSSPSSPVKRSSTDAAHLSPRIVFAKNSTVSRPIPDCSGGAS
jgi:hypothetical protein